jgi:hypothetical protein
MNDLEILRTMGGPDPLPDPAAEARARAALLSRTTVQTALLTGSTAQTALLSRPDLRTAVPVRRRRFVWRLAVPVAAVAAAVAGLGVANHEASPKRSATSPALRPASAVQALTLAADAATRRPFTTPRPDQWLYLETRSTYGTGPGGLVTGGPYRTETHRTWLRIDGTQRVVNRNGKLAGLSSALAPAQADGTYLYATLAALPPDPATLLAWVREQVGGVGGGTRDGEDQIAFATINGILRNYVLPPAVEAAFFHALASLSRVTLVPDSVNVDGRPALAVARVEEGWLREEILLDPSTYRLIGERAIAVADHTSKADDGTTTVRKGTIERLEVRVAAAIVDRPGQTG